MAKMKANANLIFESETKKEGILKEMEREIKKLKLESIALDWVYTAETNKGKKSAEFKVLNGKFKIDGVSYEFKFDRINDKKTNVEFESKVEEKDVLLILDN